MSQFLPDDYSRCLGGDCPSQDNCKRFVCKTSSGVAWLSSFDSTREAGADACAEYIPINQVSTFNTEQSHVLS